MNEVDDISELQSLLERQTRELAATEKYFFVMPERLPGFFAFLRGGTYSSEISDYSEEDKPRITTKQWLALVMIKCLYRIAGFMAGLGSWIEFPGNVFNANGGWQTIPRAIRSVFGSEKLIIPHKDKDKIYLTLIGQLDPRKALYVDHSAKGKAHSGDATPTIFPGKDSGARDVSDVCVMASKLAYENQYYIEDVVTNSWKMYFHGFYDCWNEFQGRKSTQVFICMDKPQNAKAIVVAWRGTEVFNAYDWSTDVDFSFFLVKDMGNVHVGFMEALGLGSRTDGQTFQKMQTKANKKSNNWENAPEETSGLSKDVIDDPNKMLAYDDVTKIVKDLLAKNPQAKLYVTGHSLGGALAILYTGMLYHSGESTVTNKLAAVFTFGQPRVGDKQFANYMESKISQSNYFRVVYCNDVVPRVPFDDDIFNFKHFGLCFYYNSRFQGQTLPEAPDKNYFYLTDFFIMYLTAWWELYHSFVLRYTQGPEYRESLPSLVFRFVALLFPGLGGHSPVNYVNAVRLGPSPLLTKISLQTRQIDKILHDIEEYIRHGFHYWWTSVHEVYSEILKGKKDCVLDPTSTGQLAGKEKHPLKT